MQEVAKRPVLAPGEVTRGVPTVAFVTGDGVPCGREVDPDLVLSPCKGGAAKQGAVVIGIEDIYLGAGFPQGLVLQRRLQAAPLTDRDIDFPVFRREMSIGESQVGF